MQSLSKNMGSIVTVVVILGLLYAYNAFFNKAETPTTSTAEVGADLIKISEEISQATLSRDIFSTTGYRLLSDFTIPLPIQPVGRTNPFAPIGQE